MVRRLVEHEAVRPREHQQQAPQPRALAAAHRPDRPAQLLVVEEELHETAHRLALADRLRRADDLDRREVGGQLLGGLREEVDRDAGARPALALGRREVAGEELREDGLAGAVGADDPDALAAHDREVHVDEDRVEVDAAQLDDAVAAAPAAAQRERHLPPLEHGAVDLLHAVDPALRVARALDVALVDDAVGPVLEAPDRLLEARDLLLLGDPLLLLTDELDLAGDGVRRVVARPHADAAVLELGDLRDGLVEEVAVVGDDEDGALEVPDDLLDDAAALDVEVRLRLVEQQDVGRAARGTPRARRACAARR